MEDQPEDDGALPGHPGHPEGVRRAGLPIGIVSNTGWSIDQGYAATGLDAFVKTFVLSCDLGIAKPDPAPFEIACERLGVLPERTLMVGNNRLADSGSICVGCHCLILPPVPPGATRGLRAAVDVAGIAWAGVMRRIHYSAVGAGWSSRPARVPSVRPYHCP